MTQGAIAAGHRLTAGAAEACLREGGNAFDAAIAGLAAACVVEPALASLGGGGFLLALPAGERPRVHDFFVHTPSGRCPPGDLDFRPVDVDFGSARQRFHIGRGAVAVPGVARAIAEVQAELCTMPLTELLAPAIEHAAQGVPLEPFQAYALGLLEDIYTSTPEATALFGAPAAIGAGGGAGGEARVLGTGELLRQPELADVLDAIAHEGADLFYRGEIAERIARGTEAGGLVTRDDLARYRVERRAPFGLEYRGARLLTNPSPAIGGLLVAFGLALLEADRGFSPPFGSLDRLLSLTRVMDLTAEARAEADLDEAGAGDRDARLLEPQALVRWRQRLRGRGGTTHLSVIDAHANVASLSVSNGEGSGFVVPGTGIMLNNMLGEQDLNARGFHRWPPGERLASMMAPSALALGDGRLIALGSGGSNRIRTALLQVIGNLVDFDMAPEPAVRSPRIHLEAGVLSVESGFDPRTLAALLERFPEHQVFPDLNLFFGGAHTVRRGRHGFDGAGDPRRGGACVIVRSPAAFSDPPSVPRS